MNLPRDIVSELESTGLPWRAERGSKHIKLFVADRLTGILPRRVKSVEGRGHKNVCAQIRRAGRLN